MFLFENVILVSELDQILYNMMTVIKLVPDQIGNKLENRTRCESFWPNYINQMIEFREQLIIIKIVSEKNAPQIVIK